MDKQVKFMSNDEVEVAMELVNFLKERGMWMMTTTSPVLFNAWMSKNKSVAQQEFISWKANGWLFSRGDRPIQVNGKIHSHCILIKVDNIMANKTEKEFYQFTQKYGVLTDHDHVYHYDWNRVAGECGGVSIPVSLFHTNYEKQDIEKYSSERLTLWDPSSVTYRKQFLVEANDDPLSVRRLFSEIKKIVGQ